MKVKNIIIVIFIFVFVSLSTYSFSQMPTNGNYSNWNWEDQSQNNWKMKQNNTWVTIRPPFTATTPKLGEMVDVYDKQDFKKTDGWHLLWAQFDGIYPYFVLYNRHKAIMRVFFYTDNVPYSHFMVKLSLHSDSRNPGILSLSNNYSDATDKYLAGTASQDDFFSVIIPKVGTQTWGCADFPIAYDNNIAHTYYDTKKYVIEIYGCNNYSIKLKETNASPSGQYTVSGKENEVISTNQNFSAQYAKFHKNLKEVNSTLNDMKTNANKINDTASSYLVKYKKAVNSIDGVFNFASTIMSLSSGAQAILGFFKLINGTFDSETTKPVAVERLMDLTGSMNLELLLNGTSIIIPGVQGSNPYSWNPFNCPMGLISMVKTPNIRTTVSYERYLYKDEYGETLISYKPLPVKIFNFDGGKNLIQLATPNRTSGYAGKFKKYKFDDNIELQVQNIPGLSLVDVHFALVCFPTGTGNNNYSITDKYISVYKFMTPGGSYQNVSTENPLHDQFNSGRLILYKYDPDDKNNNYNYYGTRLVPMNQFKGIVIEVPEHTDVKLRVVARFNSDKYESPIIFQNDYNLNILNPESTVRTQYYCGSETTTLAFSDYFAVTSHIVTKLELTSNEYYEGPEIRMENGFKATNGFHAKSIDAYRSNITGNTTITYSSQCIPTKSIIAENYIISEPDEQKDINIYPNPTEGIFTVELQELNDNSHIELFNNLGSTILSKKPGSVNTIIDISSYPAGMYYVKIINGQINITRKIIKQ